MSTTQIRHSSSLPHQVYSERQETLRQTIEHVAHLLPSQGPISSFVHHNTLHAFEDLPFDQAVKKGSETFGCQPYLSEERYRQQISTGRILLTDLETALAEDLQNRGEDVIAGLVTRRHLRLAMLQHPVYSATPDELKWLIAESDALVRFREELADEQRRVLIEKTRHWAMRQWAMSGVLSRQTLSDRDSQESSGADLDETRRTVHQLVEEMSSQAGSRELERWSDSQWELFCLTALWRLCEQGASFARSEGAVRSVPVRHRDLFLSLTGEDPDALVNEFLIRLTAAFVDQGLSHWELPERTRGLYHTFLELYSIAGGSLEIWRRGLREDLERLQAEGASALESIEQSLNDLGIPPEDWEPFLQETLLALRGWGGMVQQLEKTTHEIAHPIVLGSLIDFLAVRLILDRHAAQHVARQSLGWSGVLPELRSFLQREFRGLPAAANHETLALNVFQLSQILGWSPADLEELTEDDWRLLLDELAEFSELDRRRVFHAAYERHYHTAALNALGVHARERHPARAPVRAQVITCIDDREESFRRHLEEVAEDIETYGAAGFFGVSMYYQGAGDARYAPLSPVVLKPQHWVREEVVETHEEIHQRRRQARKIVGKTSHRVHTGSRSFATGALLTTLFGSLASLPMITRILFPRLTSRLKNVLGEWVRVPQATQLRLKRSESPPGPDGGHVGYSLDEMAGIVEKTLRDIGLTSQFARLILFVGHGSGSLNNPHESAYNCGACAGSRGGPNARAFAQMANHSEVRSLLAQRGLVIPSSTHFIGAYHNTCNENVSYFDVDQVPVSYRQELNELFEIVNQARERNALERCRRFANVFLNLTPAEALVHVESRSEDLAQARPEYNHATNALCIVGRRERTRGLFLDRRAFLTSYDPTQDDEDHLILLRILQAAVPVCAGINLEYYFSTVDPHGWGCGNKLPHNVVSLLGVMEGAVSDLRTGLSNQMVEIHEPVRILFLIETTPEAMLSIMSRHAGIQRLVQNEWIRLAVLSPDTSEIQIYQEGHFEVYQPTSEELPVAESSYDWFRGWRDHLGFAAIDSNMSRATSSSAESSKVRGRQ